MASDPLSLSAVSRKGFMPEWSLFRVSGGAQDARGCYRRFAGLHTCSPQRFDVEQQWEVYVDGKRPGKQRPVLEQRSQLCQL